jgi:L-amino acid N-acyltransferase YncA
LSISAQVTVARMSAGDWPSVSRIYAEGIATSNATFEHTVPDWSTWREARAEDPCLVARGSSGEVIGWAALSHISSRPVYRGVGEVGIYVELASTGKGVGRTLLGALIEASERAGFWMLQAGIFPENSASVALHESCGFRPVGTRERIGRAMDGSWRDVVLYERRSEVVGQG